LPFPLRVPNKETRRAIKEARARKNVETFDSVSEWAKKTRSL
jgi:antitoxin component of RelBE/YafQ-DinJ toxin-antitoxin module